MQREKKDSARDGERGNGMKNARDLESAPSVGPIEERRWIYSSGGKGENLLLASRRGSIVVSMVLAVYWARR